MVPVAGPKHVGATACSRPYQHDITLLFSTRIIRLFCYGFLSVVLALYLSEAGLTEGQIGLLFTLTLVGDALISLWLTTSADRVWQKTHIDHGRAFDGGSRRRLYSDAEHHPINCRGHYRSHQPKRERDWPISIR